MTPEDKRALQIARETLSKAPTLAHIETGDKAVLILCTDGATVTVGVKLKQTVNGAMQPLSFSPGSATGTVQ